MNHRQHKAASRCEGKHRFESFALALKVARNQRRQKDGARGAMAYRCATCRGAHVGAPAVGKRKRRPDRLEMDDEALA